MPRTGGEDFQFGPRTLPRSLKKQFQARRVPAWDRQGPLLYSQGQLLFVPGLGIDARRLAAAGRPQMALSWSLDAPPAAQAPRRPRGTAGQRSDRG